MAKRKKKKRINNAQVPENDIFKEKKNKKVVVAICVVCVILVGIVIGICVANRPVSDYAKTKAFSVGDESVYMDEVNFCILQTLEEYTITESMLEATNEEGQLGEQYYKNQIQKMIVNYKVENQIAREEGITLSEEEEKDLKKRVADISNLIRGSALKEYGISLDCITSIFRQQYIAQKLEAQIIEDLEIEECNYCTMYLMLFPKVAMLEDGTIQTQDDGKTPQMLSDSELEEQKQNADAALEELNAGADIYEVARKYGVENFSDEQSNMSDNFDEPFISYAKKLKEGELSSVIDTPSCYVILKMMKENDEEIQNQLIEQYRTELGKETIEQKRNTWYEKIGVNLESMKNERAWEKLTLYDYSK